MADPMNDDLVGRLEKAEAGGRELDWHIADATDHPSFERRLGKIWPPFGERSKLDLAVPSYTTSLDAALALAERVLPGGYTVRADIGPSGSEISIDPPWKSLDGPVRYHLGTAPTPALALCIAILKARPSAGTGSHEGEGG